MHSDNTIPPLKTGEELIPKWEDLGENIEQDLMTDEHGSRGKGGKRKADQKRRERGSKTSRAIADINRENAEENRKEESKKVIRRLLFHFPKEENQEINNQNIDKYVGWVVESFKKGEPIIDMNDLEYNQHRAGGPGGQNVNKVSNAVFYKHKITGLFANASGERSTPENRNAAATSLYENLQNLCKNWKIILKGVSDDELGGRVRSFIESYFESLG